MISTPFRLAIALSLLCSAGFAAEPTPKKETTTPQRPARDSRSSTDTKTEPVRIDSDGVIVNDGITPTQPVVPVPGVAAEKMTEPKDPAAVAQAAEEAEKIRVADEAAAFAKGEGERYARRQKAYEEARLANRPPVAPAKKSSVAQMVLPDGRSVVIAGGERKVFATKAAADAFVAEIRRSELDQPMVLGPASKK